MAGSQGPQLQTETDMVKAIRETGRVPVQRNTFYEPLKVWPEVAPPEAGAVRAPSNPADVAPLR